MRNNSEISGNAGRNKRTSRTGPGTIGRVKQARSVAVSFPAAGYYRIAASGPGGSKGWVTVDVGVTPDTAP